jgi:diadenosine tetraphosphatase ApaH/serine/threonine PP2A family protein phosphatase
VGQPRDGDPRAAYALFSMEQQTVEFCRVAYDIEAAAAKIRAAGLPGVLASRLFEGV